MFHFQIQTFKCLVHIHLLSRAFTTQLSSVTQSCPTLCNPMDCSTHGFPVHHRLLELPQTHVHWVGDAIQPAHPLVLLLLPSIFPSIRVFSNESVLHIRWPKYWSFSFFPGKKSLYSLFFITASQLYHAISSHSKTTLFNFFQYRKLTLSFGFFLFFAALEVYTKTYCTSTCITGRIIHRSELARLTKAKDLGHQFYQERKGEEMEKEGVCVCVCV